MFHGGLRVDIPGTDRFITTNRDEADVVRVPDREAVADATGVTSFFQTDRGQARAQEAAEAESVLEGFDVAVATGTDFVLDHPSRSVQDGVRGIIARVTGLDDDEQAHRAREIDEGITESIDERVTGTPLDHRGTDAVRWAGDTLIGEGVRTLVGATTGIDTREGDTEARTGALELADVGLTVGTAGVGRAAVGAVRSVRAGDNIGASTFRAGDAGAVRPADAAAPASRTTDDLLPVLHRSETDDALVAATRTADETPTATGFLRGSTRAADDVGAAAARVTDDLGTTSSRLSDDIGHAIARVTDRIGTAGARIGSGTRAAATGRPAQFLGAGVALGAGVVGGGALINQLQDRYEMADGTLLVQTDTFQPTERFEGGVLYRVKEEDGPTIGYSVVVGQQGRNIIMLDRDGRPTRAPLSVDELAAREQGGPF